MDKAYTPEHDIKWQNQWNQWQLSRPEVSIKKHPKPSGKTFTLVMPPPNVTGVLHQGHALMLALEDTLTRWHRMSGDETLYLPGTDHASIAVQMQVVKHLASQGINHRDLGREGFLKECWKWIEHYQPRIHQQIKRMGIDCDWSRNRFTLDPSLNQAVTRAFVDLYNKGLIYRAEKLVNWSPKGQTVLSDLEVVYKEQKGSLWHLRYPLKDNPKEFLVVATTRPETMLGDVAVAVHPEDERYKHLIGKRIKLPIVDREIPVVADEFVDKNFGSGAVKITPAHDFNDFEVGERHKLARINIFDPTACLLEGLPGKAAAWKGLDRFDARKRVVEEFEALGLLDKVEEHMNRVGTSERWGEVVEPYLSHQWFLKMGGMAAKAKAKVESGEIEFVPHEFHNQFMRWMENIHDWCISRQLWWGHQIPAWHCKKTGEIVVSDKAPVSDASHEWVQDSDVLDTWFSSGLWPFSTLGWPDTQSEDFKKFYPTQVMETGFDILFFWVARMIMMGLELTGKSPFSKVYMHPMVRDEHGQKMSKTKGNVIDPLEFMDKFGADTLRLTLNGLCVQGRDLKLSEERLDHYKNFINKVWNASKFALMGSESSQDRSWMQRPAKLKHLHDQWILLRLDSCARDLSKAWSDFRMQEAVEILHRFVWNDYCDWYLETAKTTRADSDLVVKHVLGEILKLLHPLIPHVTEEIWHAMPGVLADEALVIQDFPRGEAFPDAQVLAEFEFVQNLIGAIRNLRAESKLPPSKKIKAWIPEAASQSRSTLDKTLPVILNLAKLESLEFAAYTAGASSKVVVSAIEAGSAIEVQVPLTELVDLAEEIQRLEKEAQGLEKLLAAQKTKLSNESFVSRAPVEVIEKEKIKMAEYGEKLAKTLETLASLKKG